MTILYVLVFCTVRWPWHFLLRFRAFSLLLVAGIFSSRNVHREIRAFLRRPTITPCRTPLVRTGADRHWCVLLRETRPRPVQTDKSLPGSAAYYQECAELPLPWSEFRSPPVFTPSVLRFFALEEEREKVTHHPATVLHWVFTSWTQTVCIAFKLVVNHDVGTAW